jgi:hypothetical protein
VVYRVRIINPTVWIVVSQYTELHIYILTNGVGDIEVGRDVGSAVGYE